MTLIKATETLEAAAAATAMALSSILVGNGNNMRTWDVGWLWEKIQKIQGLVEILTSYE